VYKLTLTTAQDLKIDSIPSAASNMDSVIYVRSGDCTTGTQLVCRDATFTGGTESVTLINQPAGDYFIFIEAYSATTAGPTNVTVTLSPPTLAPANDTCSAPQALVFTAGTASFSGNNTAATNNNLAADATPSCSATARSSGKDLVYEYTLTQAQDVTIDVTPGTGLSPAIYVRATSCTSTAIADERGCIGAFTSPVNLTLYNQPAGTYYLWVDAHSTSTTSGTFTGTVVLSAPTPTPANDTCSAPQALVFTAGTASFSGSNTTANNSNLAADATPTCSTTAKSSGKDVVYQYTLAQAQDVTIDVTPGAGFSTAIYVRSTTCTSTATTDEMGCRAAITAPVNLTLVNQPAGTYYLWVDGNSTITPVGTFSGTVALSPPTLTPANDTCSAPATITITGTTGTFSGNTLAATNNNLSADATPSCSTTMRSAGKDLVYQYTLAQAQDVTIGVTPGVGLNPGVYVRSTCASTTLADERGCAAVFSNSPVNLTLLNQQAGTYFLWVDATSTTSNSGTFTGTLTLAPPTPPPANSTCATAQTIATFPAVINGSTRNGTDDYDNTCGSTTGNDVVYTFTTTTAGQLTARVTPKVTAPTLRPTVYLRDSANCASITSTGSLGCVNAPAIGSDGKLIVSNLAAGTYFLIVDGASATNGDFSLDVSYDPVAAVASNETCASAAALTFSQGVATASGTTRGAINDTTNAICFATASVGPDVFYKFTTGAFGTGQTGWATKAIVVSHNANEYSPLVNVRATCASTLSADQLVCNGTTSSPHHALGIAAALASTEYFVVVDSASTTTPAGAFSLEVDVAPVPAVNEVCAGAIALTANTSTPGTTLGAVSNYDDSPNAWYTGAAGCTLTGGGADVVYTYTATVTGPATVTVNPQRGFDAAVAVLSSCVQNACIDTEDTGGTSEVDSLTFNATLGTTYTIIVDHFSTSTTSTTRAGGFVISVQQ